MANRFSPFGSITFILRLILADFEPITSLFCAERSPLQLGEEGLPDGVDGDFVDGVGGDEVGGAGAAEGALLGAVVVDGDGGATGERGHVRGACIVADGGEGQAGEVGDIHQGGLAQHAHGQGGGGGDGVDLLSLGAGADDDGGDVALGQAAHEFAIVGDGPALVRVVGRAAGDEHDEALRQLVEVFVLAMQEGEVGNGHLEREVGSGGRAVAPGAGLLYPPAALLVAAHPAEGMGHEPAEDAEIFFLGTPDALQVEDVLEAALCHLAHESTLLAQVEVGDAVVDDVIGEDSHLPRHGQEGGVGHQGEFGIGEATADGHHRAYLQHKVAQRAQFDDEYLLHMRICLV